MDAHKNFSYTTVATAPSPASSGLSLVVAAATGSLFPAAPFNATVWPANTQPLASNAEIVRVTVVATDTLTIVRAQENSSARSIGVGDQIAATVTAKTLTDVEGAITALSSVYQPLDSDLTAIATLTTTTFGRAVLALADAAALRTAAGLGTAATSNTGDFDTAGAAAAAQAASQPLDSDLTAIAALTTTSFGRAFLALADAAAGRTALGLGTLATQSGTFSGTSSGTNTGDQTSVSGNAGTATALQTGRTIDGQTFDGTANITVIAPGTHAATGKTTPVDADELSLVDSAASNVLKKLTWANLKATIKAYTDTLYPSGSGTSSGTNTGDQTLPTDATLTTTDVTTNNSSTSKHGFLKKLDNTASHYMDGTGAWSTPAGGADKLGLTPTAVKTAGYSAAVGDFVPVDTTSGAVTVTLPTAPADGSVIAIKHVIQGGTNAVTYATGGSDVLNKVSGATSGTLPILANSVVLQYKSSSAIWYIVASDVPVSQLDLRYQQLATLDVIAANHPPAADWSNNSHKITSVSNGTAAQDAAAFRQLAFPNLSTQALFATATQTVTASTTLTNDAALSLALGASATEVWFFELFYDFNAANATMDVKFGWATVPSGATIRWGFGFVAGASFSGFGVVSTASSNTGQLPLSEIQSQGIGTGTGGTHQFLGLSGYVYGGGNAGTIQPQWAQNTSDAGNLIRNIGSWIRAWKVVA